MNWLINFFLKRKFLIEEERKKLILWTLMSLKVLMSLLEKIMYACLTRFIWDFEWFQAVWENFFISIVIIVFITLKMSHFKLPFAEDD